MALTRVGNTIYTTTNDELEGTFVLLGAILTATSANAVAILHDEVGGTPSTPKVQLRVAASGTTEYYNFSQSPIRFEKAIQTASMANAALTMIIKEVGR